MKEAFERSTLIFGKISFTLNRKDKEREKGMRGSWEVAGCVVQRNETKRNETRRMETKRDERKGSREKEGNSRRITREGKELISVESDLMNFYRAYRREE